LAWGDPARPTQCGKRGRPAAREWLSARCEWTPAPAEPGGAREKAESRSLGLWGLALDARSRRAFPNPRRSLTRAQHGRARRACLRVIRLTVSFGSWSIAPEPTDLQHSVAHGTSPDPNEKPSPAAALVLVLAPLQRAVVVGSLPQHPHGGGVTGAGLPGAARTVMMNADDALRPSLSTTDNRTTTWPASLMIAV